MPGLSRSTATLPWFRKQNGLLTKQEVAIAQSRSRVATRIALVQLALLTIIFASLAIWGLAITSTRAEFRQNAHTVGSMVVGVASATLCLLVALSVMLAFYWKEPEIRAMHHYFLIQFLIGGMLTAISRGVTTIVRVGALMKYCPAGTNLYHYCSVPSLTVELVGVVMMLSSLVLRQRLMYYVFCERQAKPSFYRGWSGAPFHILLLVVGAPIFIVLRLPRFANLWFWASLWTYTMLFPLCVQFGYYMCHTRGLSNFFVSYSQNVRLFTIMTAVTIGWMTFSQISALMNKDWKILGTYLAPLFVVWGFALEVFTVPLLKITFRRLGKSSYLDKVDLCNNAAVNIVNDIQELNHLIESPAWRMALRAYSAGQHAEESLDFLIATADFVELTDAAEQRTAASGIVNMYIVCGAPHEINISGNTRDTILSKYRQELDADEISRPLLNSELFAAAADEIKIMLRLNVLPGFRQSEVYRKATATMGTMLPREMRVMLHHGGVLPTEILSIVDDTPSFECPAKLGTGRGFDVYRGDVGMLSVDVERGNDGSSPALIGSFAAVNSSLLAKR